jgi:hypothetical protein
MDPKVQEYLANKYQLGLTDDEKEVISGSDGRANQLALSQGMMEAADTIAAGISNRDKSKPLFAGANPLQSNASVREYIMNKMRDRRGAALEDADRTAKLDLEKEKTAREVASSQEKQNERKASETRERSRDLKSDKNRQQDMTLKLQDQWNQDPNVKRAQGSYSTANTIRGLAEKATGQSDIGLIMAFNRAIDQGARTTKDDYEAISAAKGVMDNLEAWQKKAETGEVLTPAQRKSMVDVAERFASESAADADEYYNNVFRPTVENTGINPDITAYRPWAKQKAKAEGQDKKQIGQVTRASSLPNLRK